MAEINKELAKKTYNTLLAAIEENGWKCAHNDDELKIEFGVNGDDLHMSFIIFIDAERQLVRLLSRLPFRCKGEKVVECAIATCTANYALSDGSFDMNIMDGTITFRMTTNYRSSVISKDVLIYLVNYAAFAVDKFNDKFLAVSNGTMTIQDFLKEYL